MDTHDQNTPPLPAPTSRKKMSRSFTTPSPTKQSFDPTPGRPHSLSQPHTPENNNAASAPLDWGSNGEWSRMMASIQRKGQTELADQPSPSKHSEGRLPARIPGPVVTEDDTVLLPSPLDSSDDSSSQELLMANVSRPGPPPQDILRSLIRDGHQETMIPIMSDTRFTVKDLQFGIDYAFSILQVKVGRLAVLQSQLDMPNIDAADLHNWICRVDAFDPFTFYFPQLSADLTLQSMEEARTRPTKLVELRVDVDDEIERVKGLLLKRASGEEGGKKAKKGLMRDEQLLFDAMMTAIMLVVVVGLYLCVR